MSMARFSRYGRKSCLVCSRSPAATGQDVNFARSAISSTCVGSRGSIINVMNEIYL